MSLNVKTAVEIQNDLSEHKKKLCHIEVKFNYDECSMTFEYNIQLREHIKLNTKLKLQTRV